MRWQRQSCSRNATESLRASTADAERLSGLLEMTLTIWAGLFRKWLYRKETTTSIDMDAYAYFRQFAMKSGDWTRQPPRGEDGEDGLISDYTFESFLSHIKDGIRSIIPGYEEREAQNMMLRKSSMHLRITVIC